MTARKSIATAGRARGRSTAGLAESREVLAQALAIATGFAADEDIPAYARLNALREVRACIEALDAFDAAQAAQASPVRRWGESKLEAV